MHLLKDVLPAATSCASAAVAVADDAMTTSKLSVRVFMMCSWWVSGGGATVPPPLWHGGLAVDKPRNASGFHRSRLRPSDSRHSRPVFPLATYPKRSRRA